MKKRRYKMRRRAQDQERTRQRIVEATVALHGTVGPRNTSISAVAERAGVQRLTVYRHFPNELALFGACSSHWLKLHPPPDPGLWMAVDDAAERMRAALSAIYPYYRRNVAMLTNVYRDVDEVEALRGPVEGFQSYLDVVRDSLIAAWQPGTRKTQLLRVTITHALAFSTWLSLSEFGLVDKKIVDLVLAWTNAAAL